MEPTTATVTAPVRPKPPTRELLAGIFTGTPGRMRTWGAVAVGACLAFSALGFLFTNHLDRALGASRAHAAQLVRVQTIRTSLVAADANASNAFLVGGLEPVDARAGYTAGIQAAATTIADASGADARDGTSLHSINDVLATYTGLIESARANNRQGYPIGAAYLRQASNTIQQNALPPLARLVDTERRRVQHSTRDARNAQVALAGLVVVVLLALLAAQFWLYRKTHRVFNPPLVAATVAVVLFGAVALATTAWSQGVASDARRGPYRATVALATARIAAFDAKSAESLTLINRGSGQIYEDRFKTASATATQALAHDLPPVAPGSAEAQTSIALQSYLTAHTAVRSNDDGGNWDAAVQLATGSGRANQVFATFETASRRALDAQSTRLSDDLAHARAPLVAISLLLLLAGIAAAGAAWRGMARRLREYQ
jgi:hypothetical protein